MPQVYMRKMRNRSLNRCFWSRSVMDYPSRKGRKTDGPARLSENDQVPPTFLLSHLRVAAPSILRYNPPPFFVTGISAWPDRNMSM